VRILLPQSIVIGQSEVQGAGPEPRYLAVSQSECSCTEMKPSLVSFFLKERKILSSCRRINLNLSELEQSLSNNAGLGCNEQVVTRVPHFTTYIVFL